MKCDTCGRTIVAVPVSGCGDNTACPFAADPEATLPPLLPDVPLHTLPDHFELLRTDYSPPHCCRGGGQACVWPSCGAGQ